MVGISSLTHGKGLAAGLVALTALLTACGSDNNTTPNSNANAPDVDCVSGTFNGAGSSAQKTAVVAWTNAYQQTCADTAINYDAQGSNNGRTQFIQKQVPWAGSDVPIKEPQKSQATKRCGSGKVIDLPMVITPIAIVYNLPGITLTLTPSLIAKIFNGKITNWNDPAVAAANPGVRFPDRQITPVHRSVDSGTSENLTNFLVAQSPADWPYKPSQAWPNSIGLGAAVSTTMVAQVKNADGAIGYVDNPDAAKNSLPSAALDTGNGPVTISPEAVGLTVDATKVHQDGQDITLDIAYGLHQKGAYPALLVTYEITCTSGLPADQAHFVKAFLTFMASDAGQQLPPKSGYIALPDSLRSRVQAAVVQLGAQ